MKNYYSVTFRWYDTETFCSNIAHASSREAVERFYSAKYQHEVIVTPCDISALKAARERGKPIVEID